MCVCEADIVLGSVTTQQWCARCVYFVCVCVPKIPSSSWGVCVCTVCVCVCHRSPVQVGVFVCVLYVCVCVCHRPPVQVGVFVCVLCYVCAVQIAALHSSSTQQDAATTTLCIRASHGRHRSPAHYQQSAQW